MLGYGTGGLLDTCTSYGTHLLWPFSTTPMAWSIIAIVDPVFTVSHAFLKLTVGDSDGMVPVESAKWGDYRGTIPADHMDEVGQIADFFNLSFDHKDFYLEEVRRLAALGL